MVGVKILRLPSVVGSKQPVVQWPLLHLTPTCNPFPSYFLFHLSPFPGHLMWSCCTLLSSWVCPWKRLLLTGRKLKVTLLHYTSTHSIHCVSGLNLGYVCHYFSCVVVLEFFVSGSKLIPFWSWAQMGRDILFIRLRYLFGIWKLDLPKPKAQWLHTANTYHFTLCIHDSYTGTRKLLMPTFLLLYTNTHL